MKPTTDIEQVKSVARALLMTEVYKTPYSPMVVQHPFTSSGFVATTKDGVMQLIDITESEENLQAWQSFMRKQINSTDNAYEIYMMTNKPYSLTFLKYASPYLSKADFSKILADAWIRSENPNCDTNVSKSKLISMFKQADPHELMLEDELRQYETTGFTTNVIFPCSAIVNSKGQISIYYGVADTNMAIAFTTVEKLLEFVKKYSK